MDRGLPPLPPRRTTTGGRDSAPSSPPGTSPRGSALNRSSPNRSSPFISGSEDELPRASPRSASKREEGDAPMRSPRTDEPSLPPRTRRTVAERLTSTSSRRDDDAVVMKSPREDDDAARSRRAATGLAASSRREEEVVVIKSPRNVVEDEETVRTRRTATDSQVSNLPRELPAVRKRLGTQYKPTLSSEQQQHQHQQQQQQHRLQPRPILASVKPVVLSEKSKLVQQKERANSSHTKQRQNVKAYKHFLYEYYTTWFKYLNQRKARMDAMEREVRLMPGESGLAHKAEHLRKESLYLRQRRRKMRLGEFQILALLGKGAFGAVFLARKRDTGEVVAVKKISKAQFDASNKDRVLREKKVLQVAAHSPWLVGLSYAFQDKDFLFLAMEYVPGGDLRGLLKNIGTLEESMAKFYLVEMIECVAALHSLGFVHRDLKPDNFLIGQTGHLKLGDFGLSKEGLDLQYKETLTTMRGTLQVPKELDFRTRLESYRQQGLEAGKGNSVVGSPDYMAVEILRGGTYTFSVDFWSIGVIFYEMLAGLPPFYAPSPVAIFQNIVDFKTTLRFPELTTGEEGEEEEEEAEPCMSAGAWRFIRALIAEPSVRLGKDGVDQLRRHVYVGETSWSELQQSEAPFVPVLASDADSSYFVCDEGDDEPLPEPSAGGGLQKDAGFIGFTYNKHMK